MIPLPEVRLVLEQARLEGRRRLERLPVRPVLPKVRRVPELVRAEGLVCEGVRPARHTERRIIVVRVWEHHHVLGRALAEQEMVRHLQHKIDISNAN